MKKKTLTYQLLIFAAFMFLSACVSTSSGPKASMDEATLRSRVALEWDARLKNAWMTIYDLTTKEYQKGHSRELFGGKSNTIPVKYAIKSVTIDETGKAAEVKVDYTVEHMTFKFGFVSVEKWIWENGNWYLEPKS